MTTAQEKMTALTPIQEVRDNLSKMAGEFRLALPAQIPAEKFIRTLITTIQMNPHLLECDRRSLYGSAMKAAQDGLLMDGREATAVVFRSKGKLICQYMPMVGGILKKMRNSGDISSVSAHVAKENDLFEYELGDNERIVHKPLLSGDRGKTIASYAIVKTKDGGIYRDVMTLAEVEKIRNTSKAKDSGPWVDWFDEMAEKSVLKRISKRAPSSADVEQVIEHDNEVTGISRLPEVAIPAPGEAGRPKALQSIVDAEAEEPFPDPEEDQPASASPPAEAAPQEAGQEQSASPSPSEDGDLGEAIGGEEEGPAKDGDVIVIKAWIQGAENSKEAMARYKDRVQNNPDLKNEQKIDLQDVLNKKLRDLKKAGK